MKKILIFRVLIILILAVNCSIFQKIFMPKEPEFKIHNVSIHHIDVLGIVFKIDTELWNYYKFGLPESQLQFEILVNNNILSNYASEKFQIAGESSLRLPIYLKLKFMDIANITQNFSNQKSIQLTLKGGANFKLDNPVLPPEIYVPFFIEKQIPAFLPKISIEKFDIQLIKTSFDNHTIGIPKILLNLNLKIENEGGTFFQLPKNNLSLHIANQKVLSIRNQKSEFSKQHNIEITTEVDANKIIKNFINFLQKPQPLEYKLEGNLDFLFDNLDMNQWQIPINYKGIINLQQ